MAKKAHGEKNCSDSGDSLDRRLQIVAIEIRDIKYRLHIMEDKLDKVLSRLQQFVDLQLPSTTAAIDDLRLQMVVETVSRKYLTQKIKAEIKDSDENIMLTIDGAEELWSEVYELWGEVDSLHWNYDVSLDSILEEMEQSAEEEAESGEYEH